MADIDRILQLKLIADVGDIDRKMSKAGKSVGRLRQSFDKLKSFAVPAMAGLGLKIASGIADGISDATRRAQEFRRQTDQLGDLVINLDLDSEKVDAALADLFSEGRDLGFGKVEEITTAFNRALAVTGKVQQSARIVGVAFDYARLRGIPFKEAWEEAFDAIIGGGDEAEEKLGVFGDTVKDRIDSFDDKYGNFAENFALTDEGEWAQVEADFDYHMLNIGGMIDRMVLQGKKAIVDGIQAWDDNLNLWLPLMLDTLSGWASDVKDSIGDALDGAVNAVRGPLNDVLAAVETGLNYLGNAFVGGLEAIRSFANPIAFLGDQIPDDPFTWGGISVPRLAAGGIVTRPTLAMVGEAGPEAVVPLGRGGMGTTINVYASAASPADVGRSVVEAIEAYERRAGTGWRG